ncbi:MAG: LemA family protein [Candidatus Buchananbacteria bacterium]
MKTVLLGIGGVLAVLLGFSLLMGGCLVGSYNGMAQAKQNYKAAWGQVENVYQRRSDLIPNLVNTVKGYASHEERVFTEVTEARAKVGQINLAGAAENPAIQKQFLEAQKDLGSSLSRLLVNVEAYPNLKANEGFLQLQAQIEGTENRVSTERGRYQEAVQAYNNLVVTVWGRIVGGFFGFKEIEYFQADQGANKAPEVKF